MDDLRKLNALIDLAEQCGVTIRRMPGSADGTGHPGGALVRLKGKEMLFLDPNAGTADQLATVVHAMRNRPELQDSFLPPELRELLES